MTIVLILAALLTLQNDPLKTGKINKAKKEAKALYNAGDYKGAAAKYKYLMDSLGVQEDEIALNLANAYFLVKDSANAINGYRNLTASADPVIRSKANQQLGVMSNRSGKAEEALSYFKQALKAHPENEDARYNYELLKKKLEDQKKKDEQNKKDKNNKNDQKQEPSDFAKRLKAQADQLVSRQRYKEAFDLMTDGLKQDKTVAHYQDYINRLKDVAEIDR